MCVLCPDPPLSQSITVTCRHTGFCMKRRFFRPPVQDGQGPTCIKRSNCSWPIATIVESISLSDCPVGVQEHLLNCHGESCVSCIQCVAGVCSGYFNRWGNDSERVPEETSGVESSN